MARRLRAISCAFAPGIVAAFTIAASLSPTRADDLPTLHVEEICHGIVSQSSYGLTAGDPKVAFKQCMDAEAQDRESLSKEWSSFSSDDKRHCTAETQMGGDSSYTELITCLEMARDVRELKSQSEPKPSETKSHRSRRQ